MTMLRALFLAVALMAGCDVGPGEGTDRGDACEQVAMAGCLRALTCNQTYTHERICADAAVRDCCEDAGTCDEPLDATEADLWEACAADIEEQPCEEFEEAPPSSCAGLP